MAHSVHLVELFSGLRDVSNASRILGLALSLGNLDALKKRAGESFQSPSSHLQVTPGDCSCSGHLYHLFFTESHLTEKKQPKYQPQAPPF